MPFHKIKIDIYVFHIFNFLTLELRFSYIISAKTLVTIIAVNMEDKTPMDKVTAKPFIGPVPKINNIIDAIKVVIFASAIVNSCVYFLFCCKPSNRHS